MGGVANHGYQSLYSSVHDTAAQHRLPRLDTFPHPMEKSATPRLRGNKEGHSSGKRYGNKGRGPSMKQNVVLAEWIVKEYGVDV